MVSGPKKATLQQLERKLVKLPDFAQYSLVKARVGKKLAITSIFIHWNDRHCDYYSGPDCIKQALEALDASSS